MTRMIRWIAVRCLYLPLLYMTGVTSAIVNPQRPNETACSMRDLVSAMHRGVQIATERKLNNAEARLKEMEQANDRALNHPYVTGAGSFFWKNLLYLLLGTVLLLGEFALNLWILQIYEALNNRYLLIALAVMITLALVLGLELAFRRFEEVLSPKANSILHATVTSLGVFLLMAGTMMLPYLRGMVLTSSVLLNGNNVLADINRIEALYSTSGRLLTLAMIFFNGGTAIIAGSLLYGAFQLIDALAYIRRDLHRAFLRRRTFSLSARARNEDQFAITGHKAFDVGQIHGEGLRTSFTTRRRTNTPPLPGIPPAHVTWAASKKVSKAVLLAFGLVALLLLGSGCSVPSSEGATGNRSTINDAVSSLFQVQGTAMPTCFVVFLDESTSSAPKPFQQERATTEFEESKRTIAVQIIPGLKAGDLLYVYAIHGESFRKPVLLLEARMPEKPGAMNMDLLKSQQAVHKEWEQRSRNLKPEARTTDVVGAIGIGQRIFRDHATYKRKLILLSDMRHATRDLNLETPERIDPSLLERVSARGQIYDLKEVAVWVLGAHHIGKDPNYYDSLKGFWSGYFSAAGAELKAFTPERRF